MPPEKNKGTYAALDKAKLNQQKYKYYLKLDIRKYFDSIDHKVLFNLLKTKFKDKALLNIFLQIIDSYHTQKEKGLPIGNLTSQYFANFYLSFADRYLLQELKISAYVRYMDDMVLWSNNKEELKLKGEKFTKYLKDNLQLNLKTFVLNTNLHGLNFLGYRIFDNKTLLNKTSKKRFETKVEKYTHYLETEFWSQQVFQNHIIPLIEFTKHAESFCLRKEIFNKDNNRGL